MGLSNYGSHKHYFSHCMGMHKMQYFYKCMAEYDTYFMYKF